MEVVRGVGLMNKSHTPYLYIRMESSMKLCVAPHVQSYTYYHPFGAAQFVSFQTETYNCRNWGRVGSVWLLAYC